MKMKTLCVLCVSFVPLWFIPVLACAQPREMLVEVDATELSRHLLRSKITMPVSEGELTLWFPKWPPGIHAPGEQVRNIAGIVVQTDDGKPIQWRRDPVELYRFYVDVPKGAKEIVIELTYLANQATRVSNGVDSFGSAGCAAINFNTAVLYPDGASNHELMVTPRVRLPKGWKAATAMKVSGEGMQDAEGWYAYEPLTLHDFIDSPLIAGEHMRTIQVQTPGFPDAYYHFTSESPGALEFDQELEDAYRKLLAEASAMFGGAPFEEYHFLTTCSSTIPNNGLEHLRSSLNGVDERGLVDRQKRGEWPAYLLPHEFVHAWCGKYRRPAAMTFADYHSDPQTHLLWVYEGLTQYLGDVLTVRSGLLSFEEHVGRRLPGSVSYLMSRAGRKWRPLEDTAVAAHTLRGGSAHWNHLRRDQDYYNEGALFWMEADAIIRQKSGGTKSFDDFCKAFFSHDLTRKHVGPIAPYELDEIVSILHSLADHDWEGMIEERIRSTHEQLPLDVLDRVGYRITWVSERPELLKKADDQRKQLTASDSIGLKLDEKGKVTEVVPGSAADEAGLAEGMEIIAVNGQRYTGERFLDALSDSTTRGSVEILVFHGDELRPIAVAYNGGQRYLTLTRNPNAVDYLAEIYAPHASKKAE